MATTGAPAAFATSFAWTVSGVPPPKEQVITKVCSPSQAGVS